MSRVSDKLSLSLAILLAIACLAVFFALPSDSLDVRSVYGGF
jgi:hypothetical protein